MRQGLLWWLLVAAALVPMGGCGTTSEQKLAALDQAVVYLQGESAKLDARLAGIDSLIAKTEGALSDPNLAGQVTSQVLAALRQAQQEKPALLAAKAKADVILADLKASAEQLQAGGAVDTQALLQLAAQTIGGVGVAVGGPVGGWMGVVGMILAGVVGAGGVGVAGQKIVQLKQTRAELDLSQMETGEKDTALTEVIAGGELWKAAVKAGLPAGADPVEEWKKAMKEAQVSEVTKQQVAITRACL